MLLIVDDSTAIPNPSSISMNYLLGVLFDVVLLDSQVPEQGYLRGGTLDDDLFDLEYVAPGAYERVSRPVTLHELVRTLTSFAGGTDWRSIVPWEAVDEPSPYVDSAAIQPPTRQKAFPSGGYPRRGRRRNSAHDALRARNWLALVLGILVFPLAVAILVALDESQYSQDTSGFGTLVAALLLVSLAVYYYFGAFPLRRAAARWWGRLLGLTIVEDRSSKGLHWIAAESRTGGGLLVSLLDIATMAVLMFGPFVPLILLVAAVKYLAGA